MCSKDATSAVSQDSVNRLQGGLWCETRPSSCSDGIVQLFQLHRGLMHIMGMQFYRIFQFMESGID